MSMERLKSDQRNCVDDIEFLAGMIRVEGSRGMTSADITRLCGENKYRALTLAEKYGIVRSHPTGRRDRGRRWFAPEFYEEWN